MAQYYYNGAKISAPLTIKSNEPFFEMVSVSLKTQRSSQGAQRWEMSFRVQPSNVELADTFLSAVTNITASHTMIMPQLIHTTNVTGPVSVDASHSGGESAVTVSLGGNTGTLPRGYFLKFSNHSKVYVVTADVDLDENATTTDISIYPPLQANVDDTVNINLGDDVVFTHLRSVDNLTGVVFSDGLLANPGNIALIESV